jgi:hypothetical protein
MSNIDNYYRSAIVYTQSPPQTETVSSNFNYTTAENLYGSNVLLYTGLIPSVNPLTAAADGDKYAVDGTDIIEKVAVQELTAVQNSAFGFTDSRLTYLIQSYAITVWSKDEAGDYTVPVPPSYYDIFFYPAEGTYVIYFKDTSYEPMYRTGDGLIGLQYAPAITCYRYCGPKGIENLIDADDKAKVSSNDTTAGYLNGKLVAGANVTLTENNNGGNETLTISANFTDADDKAKVSSNDTTAGYLNGKLVAGTNITLTENNDGGNETLTITAVGGGVTGFTPTQNTSSPNNTVNASRLLVDATSTNADAVLQPKGTGALLAQLPNNSASGGNKRGANAVDLQTFRTAATQVASQMYSAILGGRQNTASGEAATVTAGEGNSANGNHSSVGGGYQNSANGINSVVGGGYQNTAGQTSALCGGGLNTAGATNSFLGGGGANSITFGRNYATISGGQSNTIPSGGTHQTIAGGQSNTTTGTHSFIGGGQSNISQDEFTVICGGQSNTINSGGSYSFISSGNQNTVNSINASIIGGNSNTNSGQRAVILGGGSNIIGSSSQDSVIAGGSGHKNYGYNVFLTGSENYSATTSGFSFAAGTSNVVRSPRTMASGQGALAVVNGVRVHGGTSIWGGTNSIQYERYVLARQTTTASTLALTTNTDSPDNSSDGARNIIILAPNTTKTFKILVTARRTDTQSGESAGWEITGVIQNTSGSVGFVGTPVVTALGSTVAGGTWDATVAAVSSPIPYLQINVTGQSGKTVRWGALAEIIHISETIPYPI